MATMIHQQCILDTKDFLDPEEFKDIEANVPPEGSDRWRAAVVYHRSSRQNVEAPHHRNALKAREPDAGFRKRVHRAAIRILKGYLRDAMPGCTYLYARHNQMEWLRYEPGMFFREHQDFERYVCNGMIPYVLLIGCADVGEGGGTRVEGVDYLGATRRNGALFFPSHRMHEALPVVSGVKVCLKMEFHVFHDEHRRSIAVSAPDRQWPSFWSLSLLERVDNFLRSKARFEQGDGRPSDTTTTPPRMTVETPIAQSLHAIMRDLQGPRSLKAPPMFDMLFPALTPSALHDIATVCTSPDPIVLGRDPIAWETLLGTSAPSDETYLVGVWVRNENRAKAPYRLRAVADASGRLLTRSKPRGSTVSRIHYGPSMEEYPSADDSAGYYLPYGLIRDRLQAECIISMDMERMERMKRTDHDGRKRRSHRPTRLLSSFEWKRRPGESSPSHPHDDDRLSTMWDTLHALQPAEDDDDRSSVLSGVIRRSVSEMCNDEDSGVVTYDWEEYVSYRLQTRWVCLRPGGYRPPATPHQPV